MLCNNNKANFSLLLKLLRGSNYGQLKTCQMIITQLVAEKERTDYNIDATTGSTSFHGNSNDSSKLSGRERVPSKIVDQLLPVTNTVVAKSGQSIAENFVISNNSGTESNSLGMVNSKQFIVPDNIMPLKDKKMTNADTNSTVQQEQEGNSIKDQELPKPVKEHPTLPSIKEKELIDEFNNMTEKVNRGEARPWIDNQQKKKFLNAARNGNLDEMRKYINNGGNKEAKDNEGWTALHFASRYGYLNILQYLLETCQVDPQVKTDDGETALHCASEHGHLKIVQYLIEECQVDTEVKDDLGWTALHCACDSGHLNIIQYLIETCQVDINAKDKDGWNALHFASDNGHLDVIQYLVETCHVNKDAKTDHGWNALHYACISGQLDVVKYLIETCQVDSEVKDNQGQTAYDLAQSQGEKSVVEYMEKRTADTTRNITTTEIIKAEQ